MAELADKQLKTLKKLLETAEANLASAKELLAGLVGNADVDPDKRVDLSSLTSGKVIEGSFDGQNMVDSEGKNYPVPANYASKSKLVQGDTLKLTISEDGSFIYKQIGPMERKKLIGTLVLQDGQYYVEAQGKHYRVLFASVTYFKAHQGDQVAIVVPEEGQASWAAIEAVIG